MSARRVGTHRAVSEHRDKDEARRLFSGPGSIAGTPPPDSSYRCSAVASHTGERCKKWAQYGSKYCRTHGGWRAKRKAESIAQQSMTQMPSFFRNVLSKTLQEKLDECTDRPVHERLDFTEHLGMMQVTALDAAKMYDAVCIAPLPEDKKLEIKLQAGAMLRQVLKEIIDVGEQMQRIEQSAKDKVSVQNIVLIVSQITRIAYRVMGDGAEAQEFERLVREEVRLPEEGKNGTFITPDRDVLDMDDSIPLIEGPKRPEEEAA